MFSLAASGTARASMRFDAWLTGVAASRITDLHRFTRSLVEDRAAVEAGLPPEWSNDQTEGQVNKLKLLNHSMCRRANLICSACASCTRPDAIGAEGTGNERLLDA